MDRQGRAPRTDVDEATRRRWRTAWDDGAPTYDATMRRLDRLLFRDTRSWVCARARGSVLEVAVGTGLNLEHYPPDVTLTGVDLSEAMVQRAVARSAALGRPADLRVGDAESLPFDAGSFDSVVCTFSCCAIPDHDRALAEMARVLRPGGLLLLGDHVVSSVAPVRLGQRLLERATVPRAGEHFTRRPSTLLDAHGFEVVERQRFGLGIVERLVAHRR